jgi:hypothetical protein
MQGALHQIHFQMFDWYLSSHFIRNALKVLQIPEHEGQTEGSPYTSYFSPILATVAHGSIGRDLLSQARPHQAMVHFSKALALTKCCDGHHCDDAGVCQGHTEAQSQVADKNGANKDTVREQARIDLEPGLPSCILAALLSVDSLMTLQTSAQLHASLLDRSLPSPVLSLSTSPSPSAAKVASSLPSSSSPSSYTAMLPPRPQYPYGDNIQASDAWLNFMEQSQPIR